MTHPMKKDQPRQTAHQKKKQFREMCRNLVRGGQIPLPGGNWGSGVDNSMKANIKAGYRAGA
jgi:hypothetical protein